MLGNDYVWYFQIVFLHHIWSTRVCVMFIKYIHWYIKLPSIKNVLEKATIFHDICKDAHSTSVAVAKNQYLTVVNQTWKSLYRTGLYNAMIPILLWKGWNKLFYILYNHMHQRHSVTIFCCGYIRPLQIWNLLGNKCLHLTVFCFLHAFSSNTHYQWHWNFFLVWLLTRI